MMAEKGKQSWKDAKNKSMTIQSSEKSDRECGKKLNK